MKQFQLKTLTELTSEEQQHIVAGSADSGCKCKCKCSCIKGANAKGQDDSKVTIATNSVYLG